MKVCSSLNAYANSCWSRFGRTLFNNLVYQLCDRIILTMKTDRKFIVIMIVRSQKKSYHIQFTFLQCYIVTKSGCRLLNKGGQTLPLTLIPKSAKLQDWIQKLTNQKLFRVGMFYVELNPGEDADEEDVISQSIKEIHQVVT